MTYRPIWVPVPLRPWRLANEKGEYLRMPPKDGEHKAYTFKTAQDALNFLTKYMPKEHYDTNEENAGE